MNDILKRILAVKRREIISEKKSRSLRSMALLAGKAEPVTGFRDGLASGFRVIAEIKKASPSRGVIRPDFDPGAIARSYLSAGADAISVLTDREFFQGSPEYLRAVARIARIPLLMKDFVIDEYQIHRAKELGAGMILLIAACLPKPRLERFLRVARKLGLDVLTEVHDGKELKKALACGADMIGVNNRDLRTFRTDLETSFRLIRSVPAEIPCVSESGIRTREDALRLKDAGFRAILVGEAFMSAKDPGRALREIMP